MRIDSIELTWFRGAAETIVLPIKGKSTVVYGENGSGKSSFVDAVEWVLNDTKVGHLSHEYSGKHQEKGLLNTHTPPGSTSGFRITFSDGGRIEVDLMSGGKPSVKRECSPEVDSWSYRRTVLRQDEVAAFIHNTKGEKYSALLPLLGLCSLELAAENVRQLAKVVDQRADLEAAKAGLLLAEKERKEVFGEVPDSHMQAIVAALQKRYCGDEEPEQGSDECSQVLTEIEKRLGGLSEDQKTCDALRAVSILGLETRVAEVQASGESLAKLTEPLATEILKVLEPAGVLADRLGPEITTLDCPACGRPVAADAFRNHVDNERARLRNGLAALKQHRTEAGALCTMLFPARSILTRPETRARLDALSGSPLDTSFRYVEQLDLEALRNRCGSDQLPNIEAHFVAIAKVARLAGDEHQPDGHSLLADQKTITAAKKILDAREPGARVARQRVLAHYLRAVEEAVRGEIRSQAQKMISAVSHDIQAMWSILHPAEPIEQVHLFVPADADKAIDIGLQFFGVDLKSPRLTLSEGHRNSLGLCVFLAMAKQDGGKAQSIILDDVVVSLDRNHRGMVAQLLEEQFADRQVVLLTHDREWYTELRHQLDESRWQFKALQPYDSPSIGIRWSEKTWTLDDARALVKSAPDSAGNTARKIMDIELALKAERLKSRLPYLHREKNDHRTAHDFLLRLISDGEKCFQRRGSSKDYEPFKDAIQALGEADRFLETWGNSASHAFGVVPNEAAKLIDACEAALRAFDCPNCGRSVHKEDDSNAKCLQCPCGELRWRYGKA